MSLNCSFLSKKKKRLWKKEIHPNCTKRHHIKEQYCHLVVSQKYNQFRKIKLRKRILRKDYKQISVKTLDRKSKTTRHGSKILPSPVAASHMASQPGSIPSDSRNTIVSSVQALINSETISQASQPPKCAIPAGFHQSLGLLEASVMETQRSSFLPDLPEGHSVSPHSLSRHPLRLCLPTASL